MPRQDLARMNTFTPNAHYSDYVPKYQPNLSHYQESIHLFKWLDEKTSALGSNLNNYCFTSNGTVA